MWIIREEDTIYIWKWQCYLKFLKVQGYDENTAASEPVQDKYSNICFGVLKIIFYRVASDDGIAQIKVMWMLETVAKLHDGGLNTK